MSLWIHGLLPIIIAGHSPSVQEWGLLSRVSEADIIDLAEHHDAFYLRYLGSPQQYEMTFSMVTKQLNTLCHWLMLSLSTSKKAKLESNPCSASESEEQW